MDDFLSTEYQQCLDLLKHYDDRQLSLMKFTTSASSGTISIVFAFHSLGGSSNEYFWTFASVLAGVTGIGILALFLALIQNRLYFVYPARQVNAIRRAMLAHVQDVFDDNQMYLTSNVQPFKLFSLHTIINFLVAMQVGAFVGFSRFSAVVTPTNIDLSIREALVLALLVSIALFITSSAYLVSRGKYHPDKAVHSEEGAPGK